MIRVEGLRKTYGSGGGGVEDVSLEIADGSLFCLVGPSGCGKTTTLRCIAGLEKPDAAEIQIAGTVVYSSKRRVNVPAHRRNLGMVFQSYAIWPHMSVSQNVAYPLKGRRLARGELRDRVMWALDLVGLQDKADRPAPLLSGGEQQRVALARAIVDRPRVLLLDEPLSNLDAKLREQMRFELRALQRRVGFTALYVTHDQDEAFALSDQMAIMNAGRIVERGAPHELYRQPRSRFGAEFLGVGSPLAGEVVETVRQGVTRVRTGLGVIDCAMAVAAADGSPVCVYVRPEDVELADGAADEGGDEKGAAVVEARLEHVVMLGGILEWWVVANGTRLRARSLARGAPLRLLDATEGTVVPVRVRPSTALAVDTTAGPTS